MTVGDGSSESGDEIRRPEREFSLGSLGDSMEFERLRLRHEYDPAPPSDSSRFIVRDRSDGELGVAIVLAESDENYRTYHLSPWEIDAVVDVLARARRDHACVSDTIAAGPSNDHWDQVAMKRRGFEGFVEFADLPFADIPSQPGVYCVVRPSPGLPAFLESSPAGHFKGVDPTVSVDDLESNWVPGASVVYLGKAGAGAGGKRGLRKRLDEFRLFGLGRPVGHSGGKRLWQLADSADLLVGWRVAADHEAQLIERELLSEFQNRYGRLPFANMR